MKKPAKKKNIRAKGKRKIEATVTSIERVDHDSHEDMEEKMSPEEIAAAEDANLLRLLSKPEEALNIKEDYSDEEEVVIICPRCKVESVFIDNTCPNCGYKKKTNGNIGRYDMDDDIFGKDDFYINYDEE